MSQTSWFWNEIPGQRARCARSCHLRASSKGRQWGTADSSCDDRGQPGVVEMGILLGGGSCGAELFGSGPTFGRYSCGARDRLSSKLLRDRRPRSRCHTAGAQCHAARAHTVDWNGRHPTGESSRQIRGDSGLSHREIVRCLKRYLARQLYPIILKDLNALT